MYLVEETSNLIMNRTTQQLAQQLLELLNTEPLAKINQSSQGLEIYNKGVLVTTIGLSKSRPLTKSNSSFK